MVVGIGIKPKTFCCALVSSLAWNVSHLGMLASKCNSKKVPFHSCLKGIIFFAFFKGLRRSSLSFLQDGWDLDIEDDDDEKDGKVFLSCFFSIRKNNPVPDSVFKVRTFCVVCFFLLLFVRFFHLFSLQDD